MENPRNFVLKNVEINFAKLANPVDAFGNMVYELQAATTDEAVAKEWSENYLNVKERDGKFTVSLKRSATRRDGSENGAPRVVDAQKMPFEKTSSIGNGSKGNIILWQHPYDYHGRKGVSSVLTAVQIVDFVEYTGSAGGLDFDVIGDVAEGQSAEDLF